MFSYPSCVTGLWNHHRAYSWKFRLSKHFNLIIWNVNGGRTQSVESGASFSICRTAILFQIANWPLFPDHTGHETWWPTFFNCDNFLDYSLQKRERLTYQLSSGGVGRGKDEGPFFFHHPEKKANQIWSFDPQQNMITTDRVDWTPWPSTTLWYLCDMHKQKSLMSDCNILIKTNRKRNCGIQDGRKWRKREEMRGKI